MQVVFDAQLLVAATAFAGASWLDWPDVPPYTHHPEQDCLGIVAWAPRYHDVSLVVSHGLLTQVQATLADEIGLVQRDIDSYLTAVLSLVRASGGSVDSDLSASATGHPPHVSIPLELARDGHRLVVAQHSALQRLGPFWGAARVPILSAREFAVRTDAARRSPP